MVPVVGVGAAGHAKVIIDMLRLAGQYEIVALTDPNPICGDRSYMAFPSSAAISFFRRSRPE